MVLAVLPEDPPSSGWGGDTPLMTSLRRHLLATLLDVSVVTLMATQGWLMAPISPALAAGILILAIVFLFGADVIKIVLRRVAERPTSATPSST
jgi:hypothetical protein